MSFTPPPYTPGVPFATGNPISATSAANFSAGQITLTTTAAVQISPARPGPAGTGRTGITIVNGSTTAVYLGPAGVTSTTGVLLPGIVGASITIATSAAIFGALAAGGSAPLSFYESY